jgi:hypothetical protein
MTADDFVTKLKQYMPSESSLIEQGITDVYRIQKTYICVPKTNSIPNANPVLDLLQRYDASTVEVGMFQFIFEPIDKGDKWQIANDEADLVVLDKLTGQVRVEELGSNGHVLSNCAHDGEKLLLALVEVKEAYRKLGELGYPDDTVLRQNLATPCGLAAGGDLYERYYQYLLGCL